MDLAELYEEANSNQYRDAAQILDQYKGKLTWEDNEEVLDIGCGSGNVTTKLILPIIPNNAHLVGIDISTEMIKFAQKNYKNSQLQFINLDISSNNITDILGTRKFNKVFSFYCLHWISNQKKSVENIWKIMKPGGTALLVLVSKSPLFTVYKWVSTHPKWKLYMKDVNEYISPYHELTNPSETYSDMLKSVGFRVIECYDRPANVSSPTLQSLKNSLKAVNPFICRMPQSLQEEYMTEIMNSIVEKGLVGTNKIQNVEEITHITSNQIIVAFCQKVS